MATSSEHMATSRRSGGKPRPPKEGERFPVSFRVTPELKRKLDESARRNGRSQSQEAELRLEQSFREESRAPILLEGIYGRRTGCLLELLGHVMQAAGSAATPYAGKTAYILIDRLDSKEAKREAVLAARHVLAEIGGTSPSPDEGGESVGVDIAKKTLEALADPERSNLATWAQAVRETYDWTPVCRRERKGEGRDG
jgi:hypothetical protein